MNYDQQYEDHNPQDNRPYEEPTYDQDPGLHDRRYNAAAGMERAAFILAIISILSCLMIYVSIPLGAMAIILALLARRREQTPGKSRRTINLAVAGMAASAAITGFSFYRVYTDPVLKAQMERMVDYYARSYLGESASDLLPGLFGAQADSDKEEETTEPTWSDDLLDDHAALMDYFLHPEGSATDTQPEKEQATPDPTDEVSPDPVVSFVGDTMPSGGNFT